MFWFIIISLIISLNQVYSADTEIYTNELTPEMRDQALSTASSAARVSANLDEFAYVMVVVFNTKYGQSWQCIASNSSIGMNITHVSGTLISFKVLQTYVILYKSMNSHENLNETAVTDQMIACYTDHSCQLHLLEKAFANTLLHMSGTNFAVQGENPWKIVANSDSNDSISSYVILEPIVNACINITHNTHFENYTFASFGYWGERDLMNSFIHCIAQEFEPKVNETGWHYAFGLGDYANNYIVSAPEKYHCVLDYTTLSVLIYLPIKQ